MFKHKFPLIKQLNEFDCAIACVQMLLQHYKFKSEYSIDELQNLLQISQEGTSIKNLNTGLRELGFDSKVRGLSIEELVTIEVPVILFINTKHFVINFKNSNREFYISDPRRGKYKLNEFELINKWILEFDKGMAIVPYLKQ